ncbi:MAG: alpha-hydroxy-acid oxidizing protein [Phycisphaera sp.]|nr:alpha-hydroxy-acid oxidizing protein [Phycisphaera sp.]
MHPSQDPVAELAKAVSLADLESLARERIERTAWDYYRSGAWDERTLARNESSWRELTVHFRGFVDVSARSTVGEFFGARVPSPLFVAPTAMQRLAHADGECATARASSAAGIPMCLSSLSTTPLEEVRAATTAPLWMQIYISADRDATRALIARAEAAGFDGLAVTADTPMWGTRERDIRNGFRVPDGLRLPNLERPGGPTGHSGVGMGGALSWTIDPSASWRDFEAIAAATRLPVVAKGLCRPDDCRRALDAGAAGVWISNHGGRQLDGAPSTAEVLPSCADAVRGSGRPKATVIVDGGVRRGVDVLRAIALGADTIALGRPILWGLGAGGEAGVTRALAIVTAEFDLALALSGVRNLAELRELGKDLVRR